jgi:hypothetical protein
MVPTTPLSRQATHAGKNDPYTLMMGSHPVASSREPTAARRRARRCPEAIAASVYQKTNGEGESHGPRATFDPGAAILIREHPTSSAMRRGRRKSRERAARRAQPGEADGIARPVVLDGTVSPGGSVTARSTVSVDEVGQLLRCSGLPCDG